MSKIVPFLWFASHAEEAARLYIAVVPDSRIDSIVPLEVDSPSGPAGTVQVVRFTLGGQAFIAFNGGPHDPFNHAVSFMIPCADQAEVDRVWDGLLAGGGEPGPCGWLKDRYGVSWQVVPRRFEELMAAPDRAAAGRAAAAMMKMGKLDVAALEKAFAGG